MSYVYSCNIMYLNFIICDVKEKKISMFSNNLVLLLIFSNLSFYTYCAEEKNYLDPSQRPQELVKKIQETFGNLANTDTSTWYLNGEKSYWLANIDDNKIIKTIMKKNPDEKNPLNFLDIGAGNFSWGSQCAQLIVDLKQKKHISQETPIHIVSVRGELNNKAHNNRTVQIIKHPHNVTVYNVGCFKIENLKYELEKYKLPESFDLIVTRWTLRHLVDPVGTFVQACNILKIKGFFLGDGYFINYPNASYEVCANENMETLLANLKMQFLIHRYNVQRSLHQFILRKSDDPPYIQLPLKYNEHNPTSYVGSAWQSNGETVVNFIPLQEWNNDPIIEAYKYTFYNDFFGEDVKGVYYGTEESRSLFDWIIENKLTDQKDDDV